MVTVAVRRRGTDPLMMDEEREVRENIVCYDDEGGGEEDTEAFDMLALRHLNKTKHTCSHVKDQLPGWCSQQNLEENPEHILEQNLEENQLFQNFIREKLQQVDLDPGAPPYDSLQTYAFEGRGSTTASLSSFTSLDSLNSESEPNYDFLRGWGPRFLRLAELYGHHEGESGPISHDQ